MPKSLVTAILGGVAAFLLECVNYVATNKGLTYVEWLQAHQMEIALWVVVGLVAGLTFWLFMDPKNQQYK